MTTPLGADAIATIDRCHRERAEAAHIPGLAWGVVQGGELVHSGSLGTADAHGTDPGGRRPGHHTLFRIASMTKSFTAACVLSLRDEGRLRLDDPIGEHVPELAGLRGPTSDSPTITLRHLLSMDSGLATDDPWADRHLDIGAEELSELYRRGATFAVTPGTGFVYSNLGYSMLGRAVANVTGASCQQAITTRLLEPLGMHDTVWAPRPGRVDVARGHRLVDGAVEREAPPLGDGGIAPMGGLWSTVADLARWVAFFLDAFPARDGADDGPLRRATRREMQRVWRHTRLHVDPVDLHGRLRASPVGYGFGLQVFDDVAAGYASGHSGGLPGFGSHMRWLPDRDLGFVTLGNVTYAPASVTVRTTIEELARLGQLPPVRPRSAPPVLTAAADALVALVNDWTDDAAIALFADNVALDEPLDRRATAARDALEALGGPLTIDEIRVLNRAEADVVVRGELGTGIVELALHPEAEPRVQATDISVAPHPPAELAAANAALCRLARLDVTPEDLVGLVDDEVAAVVAGQLARLAARLGPCSVGTPAGTAGRTTFEWTSPHGVVHVALGWHPEAARVSSVTITLPTLGGV